VKDFAALTPDRFAAAEYRLRNPPPGSRIEAARNYGIDLTMLIEQLRLTPEERLRKLERAAKAIAKVRGVARRRS
jgi:hypothetical protein